MGTISVKYIRPCLMGVTAVSLIATSCRKNSEKIEISSSVQDILAGPEMKDLPAILVTPVPARSPVDGSQLLIRKLNASSRKIAGAAMIEVVSEFPQESGFLKISVCDESDDCNPDLTDPLISSRPTTLLSSPLSGVLRVIAQACVREYHTAEGKDQCGPEKEAVVSINNTEDTTALSLVDHLKDNQQQIRDMVRQLRIQFLDLIKLLEGYGSGIPVTGQQADLLWSYAKNFTALSEDELFGIINTKLFTEHIFGFIKAQLGSSQFTGIMLKDNPVLLATAIASFPSHFLNLATLDSSGSDHQEKGLKLTNGPVKTSEQKAEENSTPNRISPQDITRKQGEIKKIQGDIDTLKRSHNAISQKAAHDLREIRNLGQTREDLIRQIESPDTPPSHKKAIAKGMQGKAEINMAFAQLSDPDKFANLSVKEKIKQMNAIAKGEVTSTMNEKQSQIFDRNKKVSDITSNYRQQVADLDTRLKTAEAEKIKYEAELKKMNSRMDDLKAKKADFVRNVTIGTIAVGAVVAISALFAAASKSDQKEGSARLTEEENSPFHIIINNVAVVFDQILLLKSNADHHALSILELIYESEN